MELTQARVRELFDYRDDGTLVSKLRVGRRKSGQAVGKKNSHGYLVTVIDKKVYGVHRIVFLIHHGYLPEEVDHIDLNRSNNRIANLRPATTSHNQCNRCKNSNNTSGFKGVSWKESHQKWYAHICTGGKKKFLGYFDTPEKAHAAYIEAARKHHGEFARAA